MSSERPVLRLKRPVKPKPATEKAAQARKPRLARVRTMRPPRDPAEVLLAELQARSPEVWNPAHPMPLAIGIRQQLYPIGEARQISRRAVRKFLAQWTSAPAYHRALCQPGSCRFNLDGSPAGEVSEEHRQQAQRRIERERRA